jgi:hypothetical protein
MHVAVSLYGSVLLLQLTNSLSCNMHAWLYLLLSGVYYTCMSSVINKARMLVCIGMSHTVVALIGGELVSWSVVMAGWLAG